MRDPTIIIMARAPVLGRVKSRLAMDIGQRDALSVYRDLLSTTARKLSGASSSIVLFHDGPRRAFDGTGLEFLEAEEQPRASFGDRLAQAMHVGLARGERVIVVGSDCPSISRLAVESTLAHLDDVPAAFGPATDGGFWSVASRDPRAADCIRSPDIPWSCGTTLAACISSLRRGGLESALGPTLEDCDDLASLRRAWAQGHLDDPRSRSHAS